MSNPRIPYQMSSARKPIEPPAGKPIIVHMVVNVENWLFDGAMPRKIITAPHGAESIPDIPNYSWAEYGMRAGMPRILDLFKSRGIPASTSINAGVIEAYPECSNAMLEAGWEFVGHGMHQKSMQGEEDEAGLIQSALDVLKSFTGVQTRGWLSPGLKETTDTPDILKSLGVDFVFDWVVDDLPSWMTTKHGPLMSMPYNVEINDSIVYAIEKHATGEMYQRFSNTLETFGRESSQNPRVLAVGLHPHLIAVPHRIHELERMLDDVLARDDTIFMNGSQIADWYKAAEG
ncbi:MAG: polysaccharide deacetylase family protein [Alphaproteobacteria bacterium]|nr:polysaccharide deacetylase family protein [Alphaproteobacteria bacterium]MBT4017511.1 polysaccharide deacetylase family protein [Alphaproteobacteria bacterium]MBT4964666.1 polysaccharide deacetylase family protein [Alphaproteobacteria bacterium]